MTVDQIIKSLEAQGDFKNIERLINWQVKLNKKWDSDPWGMAFINHYRDFDKLENYMDRGAA